MADTDDTNGQVDADSTGTTDSTTTGSESTTQTTGNGPDAAELFFDPKSIEGKPELQAAFKQMQGQFTKRMQSVSASQQKIDLYDRFTSNPVEMLKQMAVQYGMNIVERGKDQPQDWNPQSWEDVMARAKDEVRKDMTPVFNELKNLKKQTVEGQLDKLHPDWRTYEADMMDTLKTHPSLVNDPDKLYRLSVPDEVWQARATKAAMEKIQGKTAQSQVSGGKTTKQVSQEPSGPLTFEQSVQVARQRLAAQGIKRPAN